MRLLNSAVASAAILTGHLANCEDSGKDSKAAVQNYVHLSFDKLRGSSYDSARLGAKPEARLRKRADGDEEIEIYNEQTFYSVDLAIGTPPQNVTVLIDTGSADLWVGAPENPYCSADSEDDSNASWYSYSDYPTATTSDVSATVDCSDYGVFNKSKSSTFHSNDTSFYISYGDQSFASGVWGTDSFDLGGVNVKSLSFGVANSSNSSFGVLGVGLPGLEITDGNTIAGGQSGSDPYTYDNFPMRLKDGGYIKHSAYSLFLNDPYADSGSILFGAVDHNKYSGQLFTVPMLNPSESEGIDKPIDFYVTVQGVGIRSGDDDDTTVLTTTKIPAILDSGTTFTYLPYQVTELIADQIGAAYSSDYGYYLMECPSDDDDTQLVFDFGGFQISANLSDYIFDSTDSSDSSDSSSSSSSDSTDICFLGLMPVSGSGALFGDNFLINAYVVYDLENYEISMAQARFDADDTDIEIISSSVPGAVRGAAYSATWSTAQSITSGGGKFTTATVASGGHSTKTMTNSAGSSTSTGRSSSSSRGESSSSSRGDAAESSSSSRGESSSSTAGSSSSSTDGSSSSSTGGSSSSSKGGSSSSSADGFKMVPTSSFVLLTWVLSFLI